MQGKAWAQLLEESWAHMTWEEPCLSDLEAVWVCCFQSTGVLECCSSQGSRVPFNRASGPIATLSTMKQRQPVSEGAELWSLMDVGLNPGPRTDYVILG